MMNLPGRVSQLNPLVTTNLYIPFARYDPLALHPGPPAACLSWLRHAGQSACAHVHLIELLHEGLTSGLSLVPVLSDR